MPVLPRKNFKINIYQTVGPEPGFFMNNWMDRFLFFCKIVNYVRLCLSKHMIIIFNFVPFPLHIFVVLYSGKSNVKTYFSLVVSSFI